MDLCRRQPIWLQQVRCLAYNHAQMTVWDHQIIMLQMHQSKTCDWGNSQLSFSHHLGIVTLLCSHNFLVLSNFTTLLYSTWLQAHHESRVQPKNIQVIGHCDIHMITPKEVMVDLKYSPLSNSQDKGHHLQVHLECLQNRSETLQSFGWHLLSQLNRYNFLVHWGDPQ